MNKTEVARLLTFASTFDSRTVSVETVEAWHLVLAEVPSELALDAVRQHFTTSDKYLMPAHVRNAVSQLNSGNALASSSSRYCQSHWYPIGQCPKCGDCEHTDG